MRRSQTEAIRRDDPNANRLLMTRASQESRWDPTKYDPIQVYGELAELFSKLRSDLGPDIQKYLLLVKRYVKQSLSVYELEKKVTKLLKAESMSSHDTFIQKLSESCHLVPFSRSLDDILDGNMGGNESQKGYMPHISTINALLMLRSLENGWAAPDASAGQLIGEAVKTMISDRIDAALHVRRSPSKNQIGFRSSFNPSRARLGNAFHEVTLADLFSSFSVESHFLGAETHKLLQLKCHSNFYEKLKSVVEGRQENTTRQSTLERSDFPSTAVREEVVVLNESFCNLVTAVAHTCVSLPATVCISPGFSRSCRTDSKTVHLPNDHTLSISPTRENDFEGSHEVTLPNSVKFSSLSAPSAECSGVNVSSVPEPLLKLKERSGKRRRAKNLEKSTLNDSSDSTITMPHSSNKSARLEMYESFNDFAHSSKDSYPDIAYCLNSKSTEKKEFSDPNAKQIYSPWLSEPSPKKESVRKIEKLKYNTDISLESDFNMDELSKNLQDWPGRRNEKESKRKTESQNPSARRALFSSESEVPSFVLGKSSKSTARSGRVAVIDKKRNQTAQAIIDAWKSSSYEIVPTYVDEQSSFGREGRMNIPRNRALTSALPSYHDDKHEDLIASRKTSPKRTSMEAKSSLPDVLSLSNKESGGKAEKYKSSVPLSFENSFILQDTTKAGAYSHSSPQEGKEAPFTNLVARKKASIDRSFGSYESPVGAHSENACTSISMPSSSQEQTVLISPPEQLKKRKPSVKFSTLSSATQESNSRESRLIDVHMEETLSTSQSTDTITDIQESMALPESARVEKESQISLDFKSDSKGKKEKKFEQFSKSRKSLQKVRKMRSNRQQYDTHINETRDDYQQPYPLEIHVGEDVPSKMVSKRMPKDKHASARTAPILRSLSQSSADNESQPVAVIKRNRKRSRGRQGGARVNKTTLTLRSSSQSSVDVESPPSAVNMKGYRTNSRGHQSSAIMVETAPTQRSSSQPSVDTESRPSAVIIQGNRSSSRGHQSGTIKQSALTLRSLSQDSVDIESHPSAVTKRNRSSSRKRQNDAIKETTLTLRSASQASVDIESQPSAVIMQGNRSSSRGRQSGAIKESVLTLRSSSQDSVDIESQPSAVIMQGNRSSSRGRQSGAIKESVLTLRSSSQDSVDIESQPSAVMKRNRSSSRRRQSGAIKESALTLRSSSQSNVDVESKPSAVIMKGNRRRSRGRQGGAVMKETTLTLRSSSQSSVDIESQPSAVIMKGNRRRSRGRQGGTVMKETTLTLRSSSQSSVDVESQSSALIKEGNRTRISGGRDDAVTTKGDPQKQITERYAAQKTRDSMPPKVRSRGNVPSGSTSHQSSQRRRHQ